MGVQFVRTEAGEELAVLPRADYEALVAAAGESASASASMTAAGAQRFERLRGAAGPGPSTDAVMAESRGDG